MTDVRCRRALLADLAKWASLLVCLSVSVLTPKEAFPDNSDLEVVPGKGVVGYMEFGMSAEDIIALARHVDISEKNYYYYHKGTKKVEMASSIEIEDIGVATTFSFFEDGRGLVRKVLSIDIDLRKGPRKRQLVLNLLNHCRLALEPTLTKEQVITFMSECEGNSSQMEFRDLVYGSSGEFESLDFYGEGLLYCFSSNRLTNIRMQEGEKEGTRSSVEGSGQDTRTPLLDPLIP